METRFVDLILPLAVPNLFTYRVPGDLEGDIQEGVRAVVPFGKQGKKYSGIVRRVHSDPPKAYRAKALEAVLDEDPLVLPEQFRLWEWIAEHYMCTPGEVMNAALPSSLKLASETRLALHPGAEPVDAELSDDEHLTVEALEMQGRISLGELEQLLGKKSIRPVIRSLMEKRLILVDEEIQEKYRPKKEKVVRMSEAFQADGELEGLFKELEGKAPKQTQALLGYLQIGRDTEGNYRTVRKSSVRRKAAVDSGVIDALVEKGILEEAEQEVDRMGGGEKKGGAVHELTQEQEEALERVREGFRQEKPVLIHGVTSSGKTEVYVKAVQDALEAGKQVLYLVPEIALTTQLVGRIREFFGDRVGVYHSRHNDQERAEVWKKTAKGAGEGFDLILGARSAVFLPFRDLGLVIVDEEHEPSFKQFEPAPRYNGRDVAMILARIHGAGVILGSATPSFEVYSKARSGDILLSELKERFGGVKPPEIRCADLRKERAKKTMKGNFSSALIEEMETTLQEGEQVILFQNRRGFAPLFICESCGWSPGCEQCDISLTYHKLQHRLTCHYCGYQRTPPKACGHCGSARLKMLGFGTEKIEEELRDTFPEKKVARMDLDSTRSRNAYQRIIRDMTEQHIDILVGTQMVTKGLDFGNVGTVGVLNADAMLRFPDFRAHERAFQMMMQVAGRAGRRKKQGTVIVQTYDPEHKVIQKVLQQDHEGLFEEELKQRREFHYPPFWRLIEMTVQHKERERVERSAAELTKRLREPFGGRVLGPEFPPVARVRGKYRKRILLKIEREASPKKVRRFIREVVDPMFAEKEHRPLRLIIDVDPA